MSETDEKVAISERKVGDGCGKWAYKTSEHSFKRAIRIRFNSDFHWQNLKATRRVAQVTGTRHQNESASDCVNSSKLLLPLLFTLKINLSLSLSMQ